MSISGVGLKFYQNNAGTVKSTKNVNSTKKTALEKTNGTRELSEAEEMAIFKKEFYSEIDKIPRDRTIANVAINISEEAFKNMKADPKYREQMLSVIRRDMTGSVAPAPDCSMVITVGATAKDYRADGWSVNNDSEFYVRSQNSFYKKTSGQKDRQKKLPDEYLKKRLQAKKQQQELLDEKIAKSELEKSRLAKAEQEISRLTKAWGSKQQMAAASNPKTAEWLENTLSQMPDCINKICENSAKNGARLVSLEISIDSEDCITTKCVGIFEADPGTEESKKMAEEARARNKERKEEWEKLIEKNKEKKAELEKLEEKKDGRQYDITVMGTDMGKVTENLINKIGMGNSAMSTASTVKGFDLKV